MSQCERFDHSLCWDDSLVAWQLVCFLLRLIISPTAWTCRKHKGSRKQLSTRLMRWQPSASRGGGSTAAAAALQKMQLVLNRSVCARGRSSSTSGVSPREARLPQRKWEACSWVSASCGPPGSLCQGPSVGSHSQTADVYDRQISVSSSPPAAPGAPLRRKNHLRTWLVDRERYQPVFISVSLPHIHSAWVLTGKTGIIPLKPTVCVFPRTDCGKHHKYYEMTSRDKSNYMNGVTVPFWGCRGGFRHIST